MLPLPVRGAAWALIVGSVVACSSKAPSASNRDRASGSAPAAARVFGQWADGLDAQLTRLGTGASAYALATVDVAQLQPLPSDDGGGGRYVLLTTQVDAMLLAEGRLPAPDDPARELAALRALAAAGQEPAPWRLRIEPDVPWARVVDAVAVLQAFGNDAIWIEAMTAELPAPPGADQAAFPLPEDEVGAAMGAWWRRLLARCPGFVAPLPDRVPTPRELATAADACVGAVGQAELASFIAWLMPRHLVGRLAVAPTSPGERLPGIPEDWAAYSASLRAGATVAAAAPDTIAVDGDTPWQAVARTLGPRTGAVRFAILAARR